MKGLIESKSRSAAENPAISVVEMQREKKESQDK